MKSLLTFLVMVVSLVTDAFGQVKADTMSVPAPRLSDQRMVYDESRRRVLLFGGLGQNTNYGDLWSWGVRAWVRLAESGPAPRNSGVLVYDTRRKRTVLFGGRTRQGNENVALMVSPTRKMAFPFSTTAQTQVTTPGPRAVPNLVYVEALRKVVLVDGHYPAIQPEFSELWGWDGKEWARLPGAGPPARYVSAAVYDSRRKRLVSYGGRVGKKEEIKGDTWEWDGARWQRMADGEPRDHPALAYDAARGRTVLFGGTGEKVLDDTWEWDGRQWSQLKYRLQEKEM